MVYHKDKDFKECVEMAVHKSEKQYIKIRGANENNLKNLNVDIP